MKIRVLFIFVIFIFQFTNLLFVQAFDITDPALVLEPDVDVLNLQVDGSGAGGVYVNLTKQLDYITKIQFFFLFSSATYENDLFGASAPLTNGINIIYDGISILGNTNITTNANFGLSSCSYVPYRDDKTPKDVLIVAIWSMSACFGFSFLHDNDTRALRFHVQDDLIALTEIHAFNVTVAGYRKSLLSDFSERDDPYFWDTKDTILCKNLMVGEDYAILIGSNQAESEQQWINFTATKQVARIHFRQASAEYDNQTQKIEQLFFDLYWIKDSNNDIYLDRLTLDLIFKDEQIQFGNISTDVVTLFLYFIFFIALGGFIYVFVTSYQKYSR